jgi:hypothetical protein
MVTQIFVEGEPPQEFKSYYTEGAYRTDTPDSTMIFLQNEGRVLMFIHESRSYLELPSEFADQASPLADDMPAGPQGDQDEGTCVEVGTEVVAGASATKMACEQDGELRWVWMEPSGIPLQIAEGSEDNVVLKVLEFEIGPQPESLFAPLDGYQRQELPTGLPGMNLP